MLLEHRVPVGRRRRCSEHWHAATPTEDAAYLSSERTSGEVYRNQAHSSALKRTQAHSSAIQRNPAQSSGLLELRKDLEAGVPHAAVRVLQQVNHARHQLLELPRLEMAERLDGRQAHLRDTALW